MLTMIYDLTVYTFVHNRSQGLIDSLSSVADQLPPRSRFIIVDDGSSGRCKEILDQWHRPPHILLHRHSNWGLTCSMSEALSRFDGAGQSRYVAIHGAGDRSLPGRLSAQITFLDTHSRHSFVACQHVLYEEEGRLIHQSQFVGSPGLQQVLNAPPFTHGSLMMRNQAYRACGGYAAEIPYSQDRDLYQRLLRIGPGYVIPQVLYAKIAFREGVSIKPVTRVGQYRCHLLIRHLARCQPQKRSYLLARLREEGLSALVPASSLRHRYFAIDAKLGMLRSGLLGSAREWNYSPFIRKHLATLIMAQSLDAIFFTLLQLRRLRRTCRQLLIHRNQIPHHEL